MMTIKQIYSLAVELGMKNDLRGLPAVKRKLKRENDRYAKMTAREKRHFDMETLTNPFSDTRYFAKDATQPIRRAMVGIDIGPEEVLLANELSKNGKQIDLVWAHHPIGPALASLHEVMHMQAEIMETYGVPINIAESLINVRMSEVSRSVGPANHNRVIDAGRLLNIPLICTHTVTDNMVATFLMNLLNRRKKEIETVGDIMEILEEVPEYQESAKQKAGPRLFSGDEDRFAGKIAVTEVTGGTEGAKGMYERLAQAGVGTIIGMHMQEDHKKEAEKHHLNIVIAGHMSSDSLGMNLLMDEVEKRGVEIVPCSGFIRVSRTKKSSKKKTTTRATKGKRRPKKRK